MKKISPLAKLAGVGAVKGSSGRVKLPRRKGTGTVSTSQYKSKIKKQKGY